MITIKNITIYSDSNFLKEILGQICKDFLLTTSTPHNFASNSICRAASIVLVDVKNQLIFEKLIKPYLSFYSLYPLLLFAPGDLVPPKNLDILAKPVQYHALSRKINSLAANCIYKLSSDIFLNAKTLNLIKISQNEKTEIGLTDLEFRILKYLLEQKVTSEKEILTNVFGYNNTSQTNTLKVHMHRLRQKLGSGLINRKEDTGEYAISCDALSN
jgi:hypothetical protein